MENQCNLKRTPFYLFGQFYQIAWVDTLFRHNCLCAKVCMIAHSTLGLGAPVTNGTPIGSGTSVTTGGKMRTGNQLAPSTEPHTLKK